VKSDGTAPTLLYGYSGFEVSEVPSYNRSPRLCVDGAWGVFALANIGAGESSVRPGTKAR
jgi:prolyl oligopeptidase PreP (S9A serine peptidase family)